MYICPKCNRYIRWRKKENICADCRKTLNTDNYDCARCGKKNRAPLHTCTPIEVQKKTTFQYLHEIPNESIIRWLSVDWVMEDIMFHHIDGMYSLCTVINWQYTCHLPASLKVINIEQWVWQVYTDIESLPSNPDSTWV